MGSEAAIQYNAWSVYSLRRDRGEGGEIYLEGVGGRGRRREDGARMRRRRMRDREEGVF